MIIVDAHLHLDERIDGGVESAAKVLDQQLEDAGISRAVVLHLQTQPWTHIEFANAINKFPRLVGFVNVHPYDEDCFAQLKDAIQKLGYLGLKLHPRLQEFSIEDERVEKLVNFAGEIGAPVLIDAFPDGTHLMQGFTPLAYAKLAKRCPGTRIIIAHMGGHYVLDFMMLAKRLTNVYFDCSYSLLYYQGSSVPKNMVYATIPTEVLVKRSRNRWHTCVKWEYQKPILRKSWV